MDSNAAQFERLGFPWVSAREQAEMQAKNLPDRGGQKLAKPKPAFRQPTVALTEDEEFRMLVRSLKGGSRTIARHPQTKAKHDGFNVFVRPARDRDIPNAPVVPPREPGHVDVPVRDEGRGRFPRFAALMDHADEQEAIRAARRASAFEHAAHIAKIAAEALERAQKI